MPPGSYITHEPYLCNNCRRENVSLLQVPEVRSSNNQPDTCVIQCPNDWCTHFIDIKGNISHSESK